MPAYIDEYKQAFLTVRAFPFHSEYCRVKREDALFSLRVEGVKLPAFPYQSC